MQEEEIGVSMACAAEHHDDCGNTGASYLSQRPPGSTCGCKCHHRCVYCHKPFQATKASDDVCKDCQDDIAEQERERFDGYYGDPSSSHDSFYRSDNAINQWWRFR